MEWGTNKREFNITETLRLIKLLEVCIKEFFDGLDGNQLNKIELGVNNTWAVIKKIKQYLYVEWYCKNVL